MSWSRREGALLQGPKPRACAVPALPSLLWSDRWSHALPSLLWSHALPSLLEAVGPSQLGAWLLGAWWLGANCALGGALGSAVGIAGGIAGGAILIAMWCSLAAERRAYDEANKQRIEKENSMRDALVKQREQEAEEEYRHLMRTPIANGGLRFTARDLPNTTCGSPDFVPVPSDAPLTEPYTPLVLKRPVGRSSMRRACLGGGALRVSAVN